MGFYLLIPLPVTPPICTHTSLTLNLFGFVDFDQISEKTKNNFKNIEAENQFLHYLF